jgi:sigma-B regulation protein RsbU (phosphoserine phosphatase)
VRLLKFSDKKIEILVPCGDVIFLCSDRLTKLFNPNKENFGIEKVEQVLEESADKSAPEIMSYIIDKSKKWSDGFPLKDDLTLVIIKVIN